MENKKKKSTGLLLSILGVISLVLITAGVTYAFFSYAKQGVTPNTISTGTITFVYDEDSEEGLTITNALPKSDTVGMGENSDGFEFSVTSTTPSTATIDYIVTARMDDESTLEQEQVKLYLTTTEGADAGGNGYGVQTGTSAGSILTYDNLVNAKTFTNIIKTNAIGDDVVEKVIYKGQIAANSSSFKRNFKLNMWLVGANEVAAHCSDSTYTTEETCLQAAGTCSDTTYTTYSDCTTNGGSWTSTNTWTAASTSTAGMADYSAFEFVKLTALGSGTTVAAHCSDNTSTEEACTGDGKTWIPAKTNYSATPLSIDDLTENKTTPASGTWVRSVPYYAGVEANPATITPADWTRIKYVNYQTKQIITVAQANSDGFTAPSGDGWEEDEQYYPLNGKTFTVTINVYAEGATTYATPASPSNP